MGMFSEINDKKDLEFLSYRELITELSKWSNDPYSQVALALKGLRMHERDACFLIGLEKRLFLDDDGRYLSHLFDHTISNNEIAPYVDQWGDELCSPETYGWQREKILFQLEVVEGFLLPSSLGRTHDQDQIQEKYTTINDKELVARLSATKTELAEAERQILQFRKLVGESQKKIDDLKRLIGDPNATAIHNVELMQFALEVQRDFWRDLSAPPKQEVVIAHLTEKYRLSQAEALAIEKVACPISRKKRIQKHHP